MAMNCPFQESDVCCGNWCPLRNADGCAFMRATVALERIVATLEHLVDHQDEEAAHKRAENECEKIVNVLEDVRKQRQMDADSVDVIQEWMPASKKPPVTGWYQTTKRGPSGARYVRDEVFRVETGAWDGGSEVIAWRELPPAL